MNEVKDSILSDAIKVSIKYNKIIIMQKWIITMLVIIIAVLLIGYLI